MTEVPATLLEALDRDRDALVGGRLGDLAPSAGRLAAALDRLERSGAEAAVLQTIRAAAERNLALIAAAQAGVRAVANRRAAPRTAATYDRGGRRRVLGEGGTAGAGIDTKR